MELRVGGKYRLGRKIGSGSFGDIYLGTNINTGEEVAIKLESAAEKCVHVLSELVKTKVNYVVQESVIVIKDIFRRYPRKYEKIIVTLCENLENLDEPEAKASMIWIIGEYAERIVDAGDRLETFIEGFQEENSMVQLQLLTATVKLFLKKPDKAKKNSTKSIRFSNRK